MIRHLFYALGFACLFAAFACSGAVLAIGHRGDSLFAPENTAAAFLAAREKADLVELDVRLSSDGQLVIMHDASVDRTTDGTGTVAGKTLTALKQLDAGSWFAPQYAGERIPTLAEGLAAILPRATPLIEQKAGSAANYVAELRRLDVVTNVVVQSFDWAFLSAVHALEPNLRLGALGSGPLTPEKLASMINAGASIVAWEQSTVSSNEVALVHAAGLALFVWTVDGPAIQTYLDLGVDGIISNDPGLVRTLQQSPTNTPARPGDGLVSYWKLDDGLANSAATRVADSKGTNAGTLTVKDSQSHWVEGPEAKFGGCLRLAGANAWVDLPDSPTLNLGTNALTLSAWINLEYLPSAAPESFAGVFDSVQDAYVLYLDRSSQELRLKVTVENGNAARPGIAQALLRSNQWLHIAATFDGAAGPVSGQAAIYLNGIARDVHTGNDSTSTLGLTGNVKAGQIAALGRNGNQAAYPFSGMIDDLALWSRALGPGEIRRLFEEGQRGASLGDLLRQPTPLLQVVSAQFLAPEKRVRITFQNHGAWPRFRLLRSETIEGPFLVVPDLAPTALGDGRYSFEYAPGGKAAEWFRVEGDY